ncbi:hypothetical protein NY2A_B348L [Paramecium bursaria Chlorella virus NY2A]|uniref:Uncharacterized protein B348L n=1 Tax=Paramecium bursaria Chlorella virus NY2A TaxID=46021 RepID=A7IWM3_PBCVN|nr:hypothetical protein NY2A_B348L [Paramecium bursaria Chlorella virus NY2A]ABT14747.1 hypothetical protein NY2A_B348L [Paramecium bursaria Chlorella virus NY2A]
MKLQTRHMLVIGVVAAIVIFIIFMLTRKKKEGFSIGNIFGKVKSAVTGTVGKVVNVVKPQGYKPEFVNRTWDGRVWRCPDGTTDYGAEDKQCLVSPYGPMMWRNKGGNEWNWGCPNGTAPNNSDDWNQKCVQGYSMRQNIDEQWRCTDTEIDTGKDWSNSDWFSAQMQCDRGNNRVFTRRMYINGAWKCPPGTVDTGRTWNDGEKGGDQCKYIGG